MENIRYLSNRMITVHRKCKYEFCSECGAESAPAGQRLPAAGGDRAWAARTDSWQMWMCGDIFVFNTNALPRINIDADVWVESSIMTGVY